MTACSSRLQWLGYKTEATWGENVSTMTTPFVVPHNGMIDLTITGCLMKPRRNCQRGWPTRTARRI